MPTLLVLDDEPPVAALIRDVLQDEGFRVMACTSAQAALAALASVQIDLILTDVMMPGIDGLTFARLARARPGCPPLIFLSAGPLDEVRAAFPEAPTIAKPFDLDTLLRRVAALLAEREPGPAPR